MTFHCARERPGSLTRERLEWEKSMASSTSSISSLLIATLDTTLSVVMPSPLTDPVRAPVSSTLTLRTPVQAVMPPSRGRVY